MESIDQKPKNILLGVSGGVAAYKAVELVRLLKKEGHQVRVLMTDAACQFVTPLTFQAVSGQPVLLRWENPESNDAMDHIHLADVCDLFILAPATADLLGRIAAGLANDLLTTTLLAYQGPVLVAPAMNDHMFENPMVQKNLETVKNILKYEILGPYEGALACGHFGFGRMAEPEEVLSEALALLHHGSDYQGKRVLVTAGPTQEDLDAVRFLTNRSTGKMGYALAKAAQARGAHTILISGPTHLDPPKGVEFLSVRDAKEMHRAVMAQSDCDMVIMAAAVSDFSFEERSSEKINRDDFSSSLKLQSNPDILGELGQMRLEANDPKKPLLVGFSMETKDLVEKSQRKLTKKQIDFIIANDLKGSNSGFAVDSNQITLISKTNEKESWPVMAKQEVAHRLLDHFRLHLGPVEK